MNIIGEVWKLKDPNESLCAIWTLFFKDIRIIIYPDELLSCLELHIIFLLGHGITSYSSNIKKQTPK
jgi:hypothetical protein